jgi:hypothetical protein
MKTLMALLICLSIPSFLIYKNKERKKKKEKENMKIMIREGEDIKKKLFCYVFVLAHHSLFYSVSCRIF